MVWLRWFSISSWCLLDMVGVFITRPSETLVTTSPFCKIKNHTLLLLDFTNGGYKFSGMHSSPDSTMTSVPWPQHCLTDICVMVPTGSHGTTFVIPGTLVEKASKPCGSDRGVLLQGHRWHQVCAKPLLHNVKASVSPPEGLVASQSECFISRCQICFIFKWGTISIHLPLLCLFSPRLKIHTYMPTNWNTMKLA